MTKDTFLGKVFTTNNKDHTCHTCGGTIKAGKRVRHDVWKEDGKVVNKYFCAECEYLMDHQMVYLCNDGEVYNPSKNEFVLRFPNVFNNYFVTKYPFKKRVNVISDLQGVFMLGAGAKIKYFIAKMFGLSSLGDDYYRFDFEDYVEFKKTFLDTRGTAFYLFNI